MTDPIKELQNATVWYYEAEQTEATKVRHEGKAEIYPNWVRLGGPTAAWIPRDRVEQVSEI